MSAVDLGRVKTKSDLVVMPSGRQIFAFLCSPHDRRAQNFGCDYTPQSFYTAKIIRDRLCQRQVRLCPLCTESGGKFGAFATLNRLG
jgi:hypothetical protein